MPHETLAKYFILKNGVLKRVGSSARVSSKYFSDIYAAINDDLLDAGIIVKSVDFPKFVLDNVSETGAIKEEYDLQWPTMDSPEVWVLDFLERHRIDIVFDKDNPGKRLHSSNDIGNDPKLWEKLAMSDLHSYNNEKDQWSEAEQKWIQIRRAFSKESVKDTLVAMVPKLELERKPALRDKLSFREDRVKNTDHLLRTFLETMGTYTPFNLAIVKHWMWQVKCHIYGTHKVNDPLFLNFYSTQGTGKTVFIRAMYSALEVFSFEPKLDAVKSEGFAKLWSNKYIVFFDEIRMSSTDKKEMVAMMSNLKYLLTMDINMYRSFHTQDTVEEVRTFSAISTSNQPLTDHLYDKTGMRRFYEIECTVTSDAKAYLKLPFMKDRDKKKAKSAESIYRNLWQGIDESRGAGYLTDADKLTLHEIQQTYQKMDCIDLYMAYCDGDVDPFMEVTESTKEDTDKLLVVLRENEKITKTKFKDLCKDEGYDITTVLAFRGEIEDWKNDDRADIGVYGVPKMVRELESRGYLIHEHNGVQYLFTSRTGLSARRSSSKIGG